MKHMNKDFRTLLQFTIKWKKWQKVLFLLSCVVVFVTTYSLILPAITLEKQAAEDEAGLTFESDDSFLPDGYDISAPDNVQDSDSDSGIIDSQAAEDYSPLFSEYDTQDGNTLKISVSYGEDAEIPAGAELIVSEICQETDVTDTEAIFDTEADASVSQAETFDAEVGASDAEVEASDTETEYDRYLFMAAEALKCDVAAIKYARFFDISILDPTGEEIRPSEGSVVDVSINLEDEAVENEALHIVHFGEQADVMETTADSEGIRFETAGFSVYAIIETTIEKTVLASDGNNYSISVTFDPDTGIPEEAELDVSEIFPEESTTQNMSYEEYVAYTENALGLVEGSAEYIRLFDIKIVDKYDPSIKYQPVTGTTVDVRIELADTGSDHLNVVHFPDDSQDCDVVANSTNVGEVGSAVEFEADSFSVYVIVNHEGDEDIVTPRVEFHFIDSAYTENTDSETGSVSYTADAYEFVNKHGEYQTTQILQDGEGLEKINNPANIIIDNQDGTTSEKYFYGWYIVDGSGTESIVYQWTEEPFNVPFETAISVDYDGSETPGTVTWVLNGTEFIYEADELGCAHVYLAPLYEDYYFVNFHMDSAGSESGLKNSLLTRKLIVFGNDSQADVRIGNVMCPSPDARHLVFVGWQEEDAGTNYYATVDEDGNEVNSAGSSDGYYITVEKNPGESSYAYDLYPVFAEARWIYYNTGMSGNGSSYVGAQYRLTNDEGMGNSLTSLPVPTRPGYVFKGWYTEQDSEFNGTGTQLTDGNGEFTDDIKGQTIYSGSDKAYEVTPDGNLYFYRGLSQDGLTVYAKWEPETVDYTVVYWLQNADDDGYSLMHYETMQGVAGTQTAATEISENSAVYTDNNLRFCHLCEDQDPDSSGNQTGIQQKVIEGDGSTIVNVYYDRDVYTLRFDIGFARRTGTGGSTTTYSQMTSEEAAEYTGTVYGNINGNLVALTPDGNGGYTYPGTVTTRHDYDGYRYQETNGNEMPQYGVVNGNVVELKYSSTTEHYLSRYNTAGSAEYTGTIYDASRRSVTNPVYPTTYYRKNGNQYPQLYWLDRTINMYTYNDSTNYGNSTRYHRTADSESDTSYSLGFIDGSMQSISHDAQGWYYNTDAPATLPYTGVLYKEETVPGTWQYSVSNTTSSNYGANDNWETFLTQKRYDLGTTNPFSPSEYTGTYSTTVSGTPYIVFYYDITAKYGENIMDRYPGSQPVRVNGTNSYSFVGWLGQRDSYYNARLNTSIKGYFETMSEDLILTGGTIPNYNTKVTNVNPDNYVAITVDENNTVTGEHGITQEFRCRYTTLSGAKKYLYRIYLADPDTLEYPSDPTDKFVITAGSGSNPDLQTPPTYSGYTLVDTKVLSANGTEQTPGSNYSAYEIPELTEAGVGTGMIMQFKFMPNEHTISYVYGSGSNEPNTFVDPDHESYTYYYGQSLANADIYTQTAIANTPEGHTFAGWYDNADGLGNPFNFNTTMPDSDIILYAVYQPLRYRVKVDPNGAEIDHIDHTGTAYTGTYHGNPYSVEPFNREAIDGERPADSGYNSSQSTYINADYGEPISEYTLSRNYVPISDAVAETYDGQIYYYINTQYQTTDGPGLPSALRNALYVTEEELEEYYRFYHDWLQTNLTLMTDTYPGTQLLSFAAWKQLYVSDQKYRKCNNKESYIFLGWYKDDEKMPYNFEDPVEEPFTLTAKWRLDGGYTIMYHADYVMGDGTKINGSLPSWIDPEDGAATLSYADGADTSITRQPDNITADGVLIEDDSYIFRGWRLVALKTDGSGNTVYVPLEDGVFYDPDDDFIVQAALADADSVIHMQAVYEKKTGSYRRPEIANLTLDANTGFLSTDGASELTENTDLTDTWTGTVGTVAATVTTDAGDTEIIEFGDIQSNEEVHLYKYATETGVIASDGKNYFVHPDGHFLLGFDDESNEGDYVATYPSDSVISVQRTDRETIYAVWEPMVYITFKNDTDVGDVILSLSSTDASALQVVNTVDGTYTRTPLEDLGNITVPEGESITLAIPHGAEKGITISGTNTLGTGNVLTWSSEVTLDDTLYKNTEYSHTAGGNEHSHTLPSGQTDNGKPFSFDETLITDRTGLIVTFESKPNDYTIVLDDNYEGGGTQEYNYEAEDVLTGDGDPKTARLPNTSTRIGYELIGWAFDPDATVPDYSTANDWTIDNLEEFFRNAETTESGTKVETLYAVWKASADSHIVKVFKEVPMPGNQSQDFTFTVSLTGTFRRNGVDYDVSSGSNSSKTFTIKHGGYLLITDSNSTGTSGSPAYVEAIVQVFDENDAEVVSQKKTVRWQHSSNGTGSYNGSEKVNVTESPADYYMTEMTRAAQTDVHHLQLENDSNTSDIPYTITGRTVSFDTDAGGTVIYTNTRETKDISVGKELFDNTSATARFGFTASYELDGVTKDLGTFYVTSGSVNTESLKGIPAGAVLTITEAADNNYDTTAEIGTEPAQEGKTTTFTVTDDVTVTFKNTLKSYPVRFVKADQNGTAGAVEAFFTLASETGLLGTNLYTNEENNGLIYNSDDLYVGSYTLTETWTEDGYLGLSEPVTVNVTGDGVSCTSDNVKVTGDAENGYIVTVYNVETKEITITKTLVDPLITQRQFDFTFTYNYTPAWLSEEDTVTGTEQFTFVPTTMTPAQKTIRVPVGADVTVTEDVSELSGLYDTTVVSGTGNSVAAAGYTLSDVSDDTTIAFTNTRKTADITVKKLLTDTSDTNVFPFTAALKIGADPVTVYPVYQDPLDSSRSLITDAEGIVSFSLAHNGTQVLSVPVGARLIISEAAEGYATSITSANDAEDEDTAEKSFTMTVTSEDMITFTNSPGGVPVVLKKVGVNNTDQTLTQEALGGAEFTLYTATGEHLDQKGNVVVVDNLPLTGLTSAETTGVYWSGLLPAGVYIIEEDDVPAGYNKLDVLIRMEISSDNVALSYIGTAGDPAGIYNVPVKEGNCWTITIINTTGVSLPSTGGPGTGLIYLLGIILTGFAGALSAMRMRHAA